MLFAQGEETENTVDGLAGIDGVQGAEDKMAGLGRHQGDFDGGAVAHLADQNDFRRLAKRRPQTVGIVIEVMPELALIESGAFGRMDKFDGVFQRHDVDWLLLVDLVEERGQRRRFTASGCARYEHEPGFFLCDLFENRRQFQALNGWNFSFEFPQHD